MSSNAFRWFLGTSITFCVAVALVWALIVPIFQEPDELAHVDYAFALYDAGRPFVVRDAHSAMVATHEAKALAKLGRFRQLRYNQFAREPLSDMPLRLVKLGASSENVSLPQNVPARGATMPYVMFSYPVGYYALLAFAMRVVDPITRGSLPAIFVAARLFNVALLIPTLILTSLALRQAGLDRRTALLATFAIGAFPLTSWVAGYFQPDNLTLLLMTATLYIGVLWRKRPASLGRALALAGVVAALFFTKHQFAVAAWITTIFLVASRFGSRTIRSDVARALAAVFVLPGAAVVASITLTPVSRIIGTQVLMQSAAAQLGKSLAQLLSDTAILTVLSFLDVYCGGTAFESYWFRFSFRAGALALGNVHHVLNFVLIMLTITFLVLFGSLLLKQWFRIERIWRMGSVAAAIRCLGSGVALHLYVATTIVLFAARAATDGRLELEGRYWLPVIVPGMILALAQVPRLIPSRRQRRLVVSSMALAMACASGAASLFDLHNMYADFYVPSGVTPTFVSVGSVEDIRNDVAARDINALVPLDVNRPIYAHGYAVDMNTGYPAARILVVVDGKIRYFARTGLATPNLAAAFHDDAIQNSGFVVVLPSKTLSAGEHHLRFQVYYGEHRRAIRVGRDIDVMGIVDLKRANRVSDRDVSRNRSKRTIAFYGRSESVDNGI